MCGRYHLATNPAQLAELFGVLTISPELRDWTPRYNIAPTQNAVIIRPLAADLPPPPRRANAPVKPLSGIACEVVPSRWGLIPAWASEPDIGIRSINARSETASQLPAFGESFRHRRCLVPADGFYEWTTSPEGRKQPFWIGVISPQTRSPAPFAMAGLWSIWKPAPHDTHDTRNDDDHAATLDNSPIETFTILTTQPSAFMAQSYSRMPVILRPEQYAAWLDPRQTDPATLLSLCQPSIAEMLQHPVSVLVNSPRNDDPRCAEPSVVIEPTNLFG